MTWLLLAQDLPLNPTKIAESLAKAESVQQVLSVVVGVLLFALAAVVVYHVKRERHHEQDKSEKDDASNEREDGLRKHYETRVDKERDATTVAMKDLNDTLKGL